MSLIGKAIPEVVVKAVVDGHIQADFSLQQFVGKKIVLFFYPLDFTFVCPTEILAFENMRAEFEARGCVVVGCSIDSCYTHQAWLATPVEKGGIQGVNYPLIGDVTKELCRKFDVLLEAEGIAYRALFLIDEKQIVRHMLINDLPLGRSIDEALRMVDALTYFQRHGEVCPVNWKSGKKGMVATLQGLRDYVSSPINAS